MNRRNLRANDAAFELGARSLDANRDDGADAGTRLAFDEQAGVGDVDHVHVSTWQQAGPRPPDLRRRDARRAVRLRPGTGGTRFVVVERFRERHVATPLPDGSRDPPLLPGASYSRASMSRVTCGT